MALLSVTVLAPAAEAIPVLGQPESGGTWVLPNLQRSLDVEATADGAAGMEGFGSSTLTLQGLTRGRTDIDVRLRQWGSPDLQFERSVHDEGSAILELEDEELVTFGRYSAVVESTRPVGLITRTSWNDGSSIAVEAPSAGTAIVVPFLIRRVNGHTTVFIMANADDSVESNDIEARVWDPRTGEELAAFGSVLKEDEVISIDAEFESRFRMLPANAADGFIGTAYVEAVDPILAMAYGDESVGRGTSALLAVPVTAAAREQFLPLVRRDHLGSSLIAVHNPSRDAPARFLMSYRPHAPLDDAPVSQHIDLPPLATAFVDLAGAGRGTHAPPALPGGTGPARGFIGSVMITSNEPVIAAVHDEVRGGAADATRALAGYNGFGERDLGTSFVVPHVIGTPGGARTQVVLMATGGAAEVDLAYHDRVAGNVLAQSRVVAPAGRAILVTVPADVSGGASLRITSDQKIAALVLDTPFVEASDWGATTGDNTIYWAPKLVGDSGIVDPTSTATNTPDDSTPTPTGTASPDTPTPTPTGRVETPVTIYLPATHTLRRE